MTCKDGRFNTGNKLCSNDLRDLNDNSIIVDGYVNSDELYIEDRLGVERKTLSGIQKDVDSAINDAEGKIKEAEREAIENVVESGNLDAYRKLDNNVFNGYLQMRSEHEGQGTGVYLQDMGGTVRGQVVATDQGLQLTQYPEAGGLQTFTFPSEGGEVWTKQETVGEGKVVRESAASTVTVVNETGDSTTDAISQKVFTDLSFGIGQSWVDVKSERVAGTTYTNNTDRTIFVSIDTQGASDKLEVDGIFVALTAYGAGSPVPSGSQYRLSGSGFQVWTELR